MKNVADYLSVSFAPITKLYNIVLFSQFSVNVTQNFLLLAFYFSSFRCLFHVGVRVSILHCRLIAFICSSFFNIIQFPLVNPRFQWIKKRQLCILHLSPQNPRRCFNPFGRNNSNRCQLHVASDSPWRQTRHMQFNTSTICL